MARDQEGVDLVADVDVVELRAGDAIDAGHHRAQHVILVRVGLGGPAALGDDLVDHRVHEGDVAGQIAPALLHPPFLERQAADHHDGLERTHQGFDERMVVAPVERIEAIVEAAQPDGVERQRGHVADHVDLVVGVQPFPFLDELLGDVDHARVIGLHGAIAERLQQDIVRLAPVRLRSVGGEQAVARDGAHAAQRPAHRLVEALLVGELIDQVVTGHDHERITHHVEPEDRPQFLGEPHHVLHRRAGIQRQHVADHRLGRQLRDRAQSVLGCHVRTCFSLLFPRHCEERSDEAIQTFFLVLDCFAALAMTRPLPKPLSPPFDQLG